MGACSSDGVNILKCWSCGDKGKHRNFGGYCLLKVTTETSLVIQ